MMEVYEESESQKAQGAGNGHTPSSAPSVMIPPSEGLTEGQWEGNTIRSIVIYYALLHCCHCIARSGCLCVLLEYLEF